MRIVDRKTFLGMPVGTLFAKYEPCVFEELLIKGDSLGAGTGVGDFCYQSIVDAIDAHDSGDFGDKLQLAEEAGDSLALNLDCQGRDGCFDADQLFAIWEPQDVQQLIARLQRALADSES